MQAEEFEVEEILEERTVPRGPRTVTEYKVKWKGYPLAEATWEPIENLANCEKKMEKFLQKKKNKNTAKNPGGRPKLKPPAPPQKASQPKDVIVPNKNDYYFSDESNLNQSQSEKGVPPPAESLQLAPSRSQTSLEASKPEKPKKINAKPNTGKKKVSATSLRNERSSAEPSQVMGQPPQVEVGVERGCFPRARPIRTEEVQQRTASTQTTTIPYTGSPFVVLAIHNHHHDLYRRAWFTVERTGKVSEVCRERLIESDPRALYSFYHQIYQRGVEKRDRMEQEAIAIIQERIARNSKEDSEKESESEEEGPLDYFGIIKDYGREAEGRKRLEALIKRVIYRPKREKCLQG